MITPVSELRSSPPQEPIRPASSRTPGRTLPLSCPLCREPIQIATELCGNRLIDAILLQAERIGTELECHNCGGSFVYTQGRTQEYWAGLREKPVPPRSPD
jgi:hypothetical protein